LRCEFTEVTDGETGVNCPLISGKQAVSHLVDKIPEVSFGGTELSFVFHFYTILFIKNYGANYIISRRNVIHLHSTFIPPKQSRIQIHIKLIFWFGHFANDN